MLSTVLRTLYPNLLPCTIILVSLRPSFYLVIQSVWEKYLNPVVMTEAVCRYKNNYALASYLKVYVQEINPIIFLEFLAVWMHCVHNTLL